MLDRLDFANHLKARVEDCGDALVGRITELRERYLFSVGLLPGKSWQSCFKTEGEFLRFKQRFQLARKSPPTFDAYDFRRVFVTELGLSAALTTVLLELEREV